MTRIHIIWAVNVNINVIRSIPESGDKQLAHSAGPAEDGPQLGRDQVQNENRSTTCVSNVLDGMYLTAQVL